MSVRTPRRQESYIPLYGNGGPGHAPPERDFDLDYTGPARVPRLFKPGLAGYASPQGHGWPESASMGRMPAVTPHIYPRKRRDTPATVGFAGELHPSTAGRVPPVLVPRAAFAR